MATTRRAIEQRIAAAPGTLFLAFFVPSPERYGWETEVWEQVCALPGLECLPAVNDALEAARRAGVTVDGGDDPHWNAAGHEIAARQQLGFGGMLSFELKGGKAAARAFLETVELFTLAESLSGVESLAAHPATMTHATFDADSLARAGISDGLVRLSVGIEATEDLAPGVIALAFGWGDPSDGRPAREKGSNVQRLIPDDRRYDPVTGLALQSAVPVNVYADGGDGDGCS